MNENDPVFNVGDYVTCCASTSRGIIFRVMEIIKHESNYPQPHTIWLRYKIKPVYGMFDSSKRKNSRQEYSNALKKVDLVALATEHLKLGNFINRIAKELGMEVSPGDPR
jgi:hypothetical protein